MSRIGKQPIKVPSGVKVKMSGSVVEAQGPKGSLKRETFGRVKIEEADSALQILPLNSEVPAKFWGLYRTLIANMVEGVSVGFKRSLELQGVGYRASTSGKSLNLTVGFSHPVVIEPPNGITFEVDKAGVVVISGADKELVTQMAAKVRGIRPPEPYHGKGIRYLGENIITKVGKSAGKK